MSPFFRADLYLQTAATDAVKLTADLRLPAAMNFFGRRDCGSLTTASCTAATVVFWHFLWTTGVAACVVAAWVRWNWKVCSTGTGSGGLTAFCQTVTGLHDCFGIDGEEGFSCDLDRSCRFSNQCAGQRYTACACFRICCNHRI